MKKFLCYDTNDVANGKIDVDSRGVLKSASSSAQADWNVMDSNDPAFIKNKPFGMEKGKEIGSWYYDGTYTQDDQGRYVYTFTTDTGDWSFELAASDETVEADIIIDDVTYESVRAHISSYSGGTDYNFITDGLPFSLRISVRNGSDPDTLTFTYDKNQFTTLTIIDKNRQWTKTLDIKYLDTAKLRAEVLPSANDKQHLIYDYGSGKFISSFDIYLRSSTNRIFKLNVDDEGNLSATQV